MFINTSQQYSAGDIVSFKLVNGDEMIAEILEINVTGWTIKKPCIVVPSQQGIGLMQALFTGNVDKPINLEKSHVLLHSETIPEMNSHYIRTTTGIDVGVKKGIIT